MSILGAEIPQIYARYIEPGQPAEITFKYLPGHVYTARVSTGQMQPSGFAVTPKAVQAAPFVVRLRLDDAELAKRLPAGSVGQAAIFTEHLKPTHIIRRVMLRMTAIVNYLFPY